MTSTLSVTLPDTLDYALERAYADALGYLDSLNISSIKLGLERSLALLDTMGNPQDALPMAHIAGTNGKGSVTAMLSRIMQAAGYKTGRFISPHLSDVRERVVINSEMISKVDFATEISALRAHLNTIQTPETTYFEFINTLAYRYFQKQNVDFTVFETGLGGRLDSTNVVKKPNVTVITGIGLDHTKQLGNTLAAIAAEKAGIIKSGVPVVLGPNLSAEAQTVILAIAKERNAPVIQADASVLQMDEAASCSASRLVLNHTKTGEIYRVNLAAPYQRDNVATVLACVEALRQQGFAISPEAVHQGLEDTRWPARFQIVPPMSLMPESLIIDGSHNADGFKSLKEALRLYFSNRPMVWLISLRNNRPLTPLLALLDEFQPLAVMTTQSEPHNLYYTPEELASVVQTYLSVVAPNVPVNACATPRDALALMRQCLQRHSEKNPVGLATGSLYTAGQLLDEIENTR